jgi:RHS repeat-associated protein
MSTDMNGGKAGSKTGDGVTPDVQGGKLAQVTGRLIEGGGADASQAAKKEGDPEEEGTECREEGHPVEVISGQVVDSALDLALPGPIPVAWRRLYFSSFHADRSPLGRGGWTHELHQFVGVVKDKLVLRGPTGRNLPLPDVEVGATAILRGKQLAITRFNDERYEVQDLKSRVTRVFSPLDRSAGLSMLRAIKDPWGNQVDFVYDGGRLTTVKAFGRDLRITHDSKGNILRVAAWAEGAEQQAIVYAYSQHGELARATDALGHAEHFAYDALHRMVKTTLKNGVSFYYAYDDETGRCVHTWGDGGLHDVEFTYDLKAGETVAAGEHVRVYTWANGALLKEATPDGDFSTEYTYDADDLILTEKNAAGETWEHEYDERGHRVRTVDPAGNETKWVYRGDLLVRRISPDGHVTSLTYNSQGAPLEVRGPTGETFQLGYDGAGHLSYVYGDDGMLASYAYDERQTLAKVTDARGASTEYTYDVLGRPLTQTDTLGRVTAIEYDAKGRPVVITRPDGTRVQLAYDALGNVVRQVDAMGRVTRMEYAGTGVLVRQTQPNGQVWSFAYDGMERLRTITNPKTETYEFSYDRGDRVVEERTFDGRVLAYSYDRSGNLRRIDYPDETFREFVYDSLGNVLEEESSHGSQVYARDKVGRLLEATVVEHNGKTTVKLERDPFGRVVSEIQNGLAIRTTLDAHGKRSARQLPAGETTKYAYDRAGSLQSVDHDGHKVSITRDAVGRETRRESAKALIEIVSTYDAMDRLESRVAKAASRAGDDAHRALSERKWSYDANGRATEVEDSRWGKTRYAYDELGQLIEASRGKLHEVFYYDAAGSLSAIVEGLTARALPWTVGEGNVLLQTEDGAIDYDARRRRVSERSAAGEVTKYWWDCRDRLREVELPDGTRALYTYDAFGRRVRKDLVPASSNIVKMEPERVRTVSFLWDGNVLAQEIDSERGKRVFVHGARGSFTPMLQQEQGEVFTYVTDHLGTPKEMVDSNGRVAWSSSQSAWGTVIETWRDAGARVVESPFRLLGQYFDEETGLAYARFRYFDAAKGRWISPDPLGIDGGNNLAAFDGSPSNDSDPLGLVNLNTNDATGNFGVYQITIDGNLFKYGKADLDRVTQSSGDPTRLHQQLRKLREQNPDADVEGKVILKGFKSTDDAKAAETAKLDEHYEKTGGEIPEGNKKSYKGPKNTSKKCAK